MRVTIQSRNGEPRVVASWPSGVRGLSVVPFIWDDMTVEPGWYRLSHDESGLAFPYAWPSRAAVKRCAATVADLVDWTDSFDDLRSHPALDALQDAGRVEGVSEDDLWWRLHGYGGADRD